MTNTRTLWISLAALLVASFAVLLAMGGEIYRKAPPLPDRVVAEDGSLIYDGAEIQRGRQVWQSIGGMQLGSIWGHGGYVAPDWSADWLHREALAVLDMWAQREAQAETYDDLPAEQRAALRGRLETRMRANTYDPATRTITLDADRAAAIERVAAHYQSLFGNDPATAALREAYAMKNDTVPAAEHRRALTAFVWWTAWAAVTEAARTTTSRTRTTGPASRWSATARRLPVPVVGVQRVVPDRRHRAARLAPRRHAQPRDEPHRLPAADPLALVRLTPSMRATAKYFWVVLALFLVQILLGAITAHYQVEGQELYGFELSDILPYSLTRTWHTQLAVLWIATAWLGTGLYIAPAISGHEPKFQRLGVNVLFVCLLVIVVGAFAGQWFAVMQTAAAGAQFLVRPPRLGVRRHRPLLAMVPVRRAHAMAGARRPRAVARDQARRRLDVDRRCCFSVRGCDRPVLRRRV